MATPATLTPTAEETQYQAVAQRYLEEMAQLREQMQRSRRAMEQSRNETGSLLSQIDALFSKKQGPQ